MKKRVLITVNNLCGYTGSELHTVDIAGQFVKHDYDVTIATFHARYPLLGFAEKMGVDVVDIKKQKLPFDYYDVFFAQHFATANDVIISNNFSFGKLVCESLSSFEPYESLPLFSNTADLLLFVTENTRNKRILALPEYPLDKTFIFNNYASDSFFDNHKEIGTLKKIVIVSNHCTKELIEFFNIAKKSSYTVDWIGKCDARNYAKKVDGETLASYDLVITIGRTVQYCFAMGLPIYCYDYWGGPGYICEDNFDVGRINNFSGRCCSTKRTGMELFEDIVNSYDVNLSSIEYLRRMAYKYFNLESIFCDFLSKLDEIEEDPRSLNNYFSTLEEKCIPALSRELSVLRNHKRSLTNIYFSSGGTFTEEKRRSYKTIFQAEIVLEMDIPEGSQNLRFDPVEGEFCICLLNEVKIDGSIVDRITPNSAHKKLSNNVTAFCDRDPQYLINIKGLKSPKTLSIRFVLFTMNVDDVIDWSKNRIKSKKLPFFR